MLGFLSRFVDSNDRELKRIQPFVDEASELEAEIKGLSDEDIQSRFLGLRDEFRETVIDEEPSDDELHHPDLERRRELAKARRKREHRRRSRTPSTTSSRTCSRWPARRWSGRSRCATSTSSSSAAPSSTRARSRRCGRARARPSWRRWRPILNAIAGKGVHIVTVNDYLARRDPQWMGPIFHFLGLTVGMILGQQSDGGAASYVFEPGYPTNDERLINLKPVSRRGGLRRRHHVRHEQRVRVRLPPRQHGHGAGPAGAARALLRDRRRGRQHPHRRGADAADHQRPGRGIR